MFEENLSNSRTGSILRNKKSTPKIIDNAVIPWYFVFLNVFYALMECNVILLQMRKFKNQIDKLHVIKQVHTNAVIWWVLHMSPGLS